MNFVIFLLNFDEILSEFHEKFQEITKVLNILRNSARKIRKMLEIARGQSKFLIVCASPLIAVGMFDVFLRYSPSYQSSF